MGMDENADPSSEHELSKAEAAFLAGWFAGKGIAEADITLEALSEAAAALANYNVRCLTGQRNLIKAIDH